MTTTFTQLLCTALIAVTLLTSCSRPVAYFQRGPVSPAATSGTQSVAVAAPVKPLTETGHSLAPTSEIVGRTEAFVLNDSKPAVNKTLSKRMSHIRQMLTSTTGTQSLDATRAPHKMKGIEKLMLRKINKQISKQLSPNHPEKALVSKGKLIGSIILLVAGLLMLILGTGTLAFIGLIVGLIGAVGTIVNLFGI